MICYKIHPYSIKRFLFPNVSDLFKKIKKLKKKKIVSGFGILTDKRNVRLVLSISN
jgi:tryptophan synthase alpha subunit